MLARRLLLPLVFVAGMTSLAVEFGASRLLAPYFGTSLYVWGVLIGLILVYLSAGYVLGGRLADRYPRDDLLFTITAVAALWIGLVPLAAYPILLLSQQGFATLSAGLVLGTLLAVILLFALPVILLGCVSPFAIRLLLRDVEHGGNTAGAVYALSTAGSILGTFLPVFWFIPSYGTRPTLIGFSLVLLAISVAGLWPRRRWLGALGVVVIAAGILLETVGIKPPAEGRLLYEKESAYNYIQVTQVGDENRLILNEGEAVHSIYDPGTLLTEGPWDDMLLAPFFSPAAPSSEQPLKVLIVGLAGGTAARQYRAAFPNADITGVEIDPDIVSAGYRFFSLGSAHVDVVVQDGRYFLATDPTSYDVIVMDAYRQPYIPFHLMTREFFQLARDHLRPGGVVVVNAGRTAKDFRLVDAVASTMRPVFASVLLLDTTRFTNTLVYGTAEPASVGEVREHIAGSDSELVHEVAVSALPEGDLRLSPYHGQVYTDDLAPVERLIDSIILGYITGR